MAIPIYEIGAAGRNEMSNAQKKTAATANKKTATSAGQTLSGTPSDSGSYNFIYEPSKSTAYMDMYNNYANRVNQNYNDRLASERGIMQGYIADLTKRRDSNLENLANTYAAQKGQMGTAYDTSRTNTNSGYDNSARQNYINYMQAQKNLPDQLNALGIRGGASESSLIRLGSNYGTNVASNESARQNALAELERQYKENLFNAQQAYNQQVADINDSFSTQSASYMDSYNKLLSELAAGKADSLTTAYQTALENDKKAADEAAAKDLEQFADYVVGLYKTKDGYLKLIEKLKASNDPNKTAKIGLARKAMNALEEQLAASGGGSSSRSYGYGGYGGYGGGGSSDDGGDNTTTKTTSKNKNGIGTGASATTRAANPAIVAAQARGQSTTNYYNNLLNKNKNKGRYYEQREDYYVPHFR